MKPIQGLVRGKKMGFLEIQLQSGRLIHIPEQKDLSFGDKVWICFDYTTMSAREVWTEEEYLEADKFEEPPEEESPYPDWLPPHQTLNV